MAPNIPKDKRADIANQAYRLAIKRVSYVDIASRLGITRQTVSLLVKEEMEARSEDWVEADAERAVAIASYEEVIQRAWSGLAARRLNPNSHNVTGFLNVIVAAQREIDQITGVRSIEIDDTAKAAELFLEGARAYREMDAERREEEEEVRTDIERSENALDGFTTDESVIRPQPFKS